MIDPLESTYIADTFSVYRQLYFVLESKETISDESVVIKIFFNSDKNQLYHDSLTYADDRKEAHRVLIGAWSPREEGEYEIKVKLFSDSVAELSRIYYMIK